MIARETMVTLCGSEGCRLLSGHRGAHSKFPVQAWSFFQDKDNSKLNKAGFATPRGGQKGAYQNHVSRSNRVIVPFEKLGVSPLADFANGYVIRLFPEQYFATPRQPKPQFLTKTSTAIIGKNAFILYRSHADYQNYPPLPNWKLRSLVNQNGAEIQRRSREITDNGHYVVRLPKLGGRDKQILGPPQGIFAPEYANENVNFLCKCILAWLTIHTVNSPYTTSQATHLKAILLSENLLNDAVWENRGVLRRGLTACPLCTKFVNYEDLHAMLLLDDEDALSNAGLQIEGATRSTIVNLFHLEPLRYDRLDHKPESIAWGMPLVIRSWGSENVFSCRDAK